MDNCPLFNGNQTVDDARVQGSLDNIIYVKADVAVAIKICSAMGNGETTNNK